MAFDIREIFTRALGGRSEREGPFPDLSPEDDSDEDRPETPVGAAMMAAVNPSTDDMGQGGATSSTAMIPEGVSAMPSAAVDTTASKLDEAVEDEQAKCVAEVAVAAAVVHGPLDDDEFEDIVESLREVPGLDDFDAAAATELVASLRAEIESEDDPDEFLTSMESRLEEISSTLSDPALRRATYQLAVYFCAWDGVITDQESDFLEATAEAFEISDFEARDLREATIVESSGEHEFQSAPH